MGSEWRKMGREGRRGGDVVGTAGEGIWFAIGGSLPVADGVVVGCQSSCPSGMASGGSAGLGEVLQVLVVGVDLDRVLRSFDVDSPLPKTFDHRKELFVVDWVVQLSSCEFSRIEADRV